MKAPVAMTVTAPMKYQVISNGRPVEETDLGDGRRKTSWREDVPIPTWQISLGAAPFAVGHFGTVRGVPLSAWVYPQERDDSFKGFSEATQPVLEFFSDHIGPYSYEKLAQVEATTVSGGMELASDIFYGYRGVPGRQLVAHEMAHQWFGDSATERDWDDVWLSEGFATYFALLYQEHADGRDAFVDGVRRSAAGAVNYAIAHPDSTIVHDNLADVSKVIANNAQIYQGGAQVLHMLRGVLGDDRFWAGIRLYYSRYRNSNASTDDFRHAMEDACRATADCPADCRDLAWFFHEWLNRGGALKLEGTWHYDAEAKQVVVSLDQTQTTGLYRMPIEVAVMTPPAAAPPAGAVGAPAGAATAGAGAGRQGGTGAAAGRQGGAGQRGAGATPASTTTRVWIDQAHTTATIPVAAEPTSVELDPHVWVTLAQVTFKKQ
jgi:aminopeptidase N